ncbi:HigA family addiction module antidote protein [Deltaproteobacteria bacterium OttesenSCG-928-M10]|nr:HigA family addiction module antidote protein [Deltaproteobacteria bacterium OttesenSCG-928-M10]
MKQPIRIHPGEILREEFLLPLGVSANQLALELRVPVSRIYDLVHERRGITPDTAARLGRFFGTTAHFWMNLQNTYDLFQLEDSLAEELSRIQPHLTVEAGSMKHSY